MIFIQVLHCFALWSLLNCVECRIHSLHLKNDQRNMVTLSTFGYYKGGSLFVNITNMNLPANYNGLKTSVLGFSFDRSTNKDTTHYVEEEENSGGKCVLHMENNELKNDATQAILKIVHSPTDGQFYLRIYQDSGLHFSLNSLREPVQTVTPNNVTNVPKSTSKDDSNKSSAEEAPEGDEAKKEEEKKQEGVKDDNDTKKNDTEKEDETQPEARRKRESNDDYIELPIEKKDNSVQIQFYVHIDTDKQEGLYQLFFHNCYRYPDRKIDLMAVTLTTHITERNGENYLSAGEMPLPMMYMVLAVLFFVSALYWINILRISSSNKVFKIHYLMAVFILIKALSVTFHAIDYHFIARDGLPETWAIIFYIVYLLKGVLLILCLLLVATGWAFIKYVLSDKEKKLFMIIIPLQVIASIAYIIMEGTEEGSENYATWKNIMMLVSIVCVAAILVPVVWSIRHLHQASQTDGKAAMNLAKLRLFREFYILVVLYLYFTRIIVYLLQLTLPYKLTWIYLLFAELGSMVFFIVVGYKFRPGCDNPYFQLPDYDSNDEEAQALTPNGAKETLSRVNRKQESSSGEEDELFSRHTISKM